MKADELDSDEISFVDFFTVIFKRKKFILAFSITGMIGVFVFSVLSILLPPEKSFLPNFYTPRAIMLINESSSDGLSSALASTGISDLASLVGISSGGTSYGSLSTYIVNIESYLDEIVNKFNLVERYGITKFPQTNSRKELKKHLFAEYTEATGVLTLSFEDIDPQFATDVVNFAVELLDRQFTVIGGNRNQTRKVQLEEKLADVAIEMKRLENEIEAFQTKYGVISIESLATEHISTVAQIRSELIMKDMEISTYQTLAQVEDPQLRRLKTERKNLVLLLKELDEGFDSYETGFPSQKDLPKIALEYTHLERDLMIQVEIYKLLIQQYEATKLSLSGEEPVFQIIQVAKVPDRKSGPSRGLICIIVTLGAAVLSILIAFMLESIQKTLSNPEQRNKLEKAWRGR